jgi:hypothetical protein
MTWQDGRVPRPEPARVLAAARTSRRSFLRGLAGVTGVATVGTLAGCDLFGSDKPNNAAPDALAPFLTATAALADKYDAALAAAGGLPPTVTQVRDVHRAHVRALADTLRVATPKPAPSSAKMPTTAVEALAALVSAEKSAHDEAAAACLAGTGRVAPLLGSIAAARASHLEVLK